ncbi:helix-turn-helix domain-containing protein [Streptomyces bambusae]|uniref:helix-turn-helix domain-containing protein n=1 Tax=Streptomyces bambusae TaxID=1550616 RepID=UPI001CFF51A0|nr:helix-turn-helix domain-containing protein [Streptomyces bambusae]MCB5168012.1 helix-turn-helix domain-containing protein [Streptomyces bambusae]
MREAGGELWFTIREAALFLGRSPKTLYSWRDRGILGEAAHDERGRAIYSQRQLAAAERQVRERAQRILGRAA